MVRVLPYLGWLFLLACPFPSLLVSLKTFESCSFPTPRLNVLRTRSALRSPVRSFPSVSCPEACFADCVADLICHGPCLHSAWLPSWFPSREKALSFHWVISYLISKGKCLRWLCHMHMSAVEDENPLCCLVIRVLNAWLVTMEGFKYLKGRTWLIRH